MTFAETDSPESFALAIPAKYHLVAVLQEPARLARRQVDRLGASPGQFDQTAQAVFRRARDRAARDQVARPQVATVARVMREHLRERPVEVPRIARAEAMRGDPLFTHL